MTRVHVRLAAVLTATALTASLGACSGGGTDLAVGGQAVNGSEAAVASSVVALGQFSSDTGANIENATCHLRFTELGARGSDAERVPQSVDCVPIGLLGNGGFNAVSFTVSLQPDPERTKDLVIVPDTDTPIVTTFNAGTDSFLPALPEQLPDAGEPSVPDGYILIADRLVRSADLQAAQTQAIDAMRLDTTHDANIKFTLADNPTCLFEATLDSIWCGPGVSLVDPEGEVYNTSLSISYLDTTTYQLVASDSAGAAIGEYGDWQPVGSEPSSLIDVEGTAATLPSLDTIEAPEIPALEAGHFAEVEPDDGWLSDCVATDTAADLCDTEIDQHLEANPTTLVFTSGKLTIERLAFGEQTGSDDPGSIIEAERAADGERLVGMTVNLERNDDVIDTTPLNAQILVNGEVKGDFGNASGYKGFFLSAPADATVSVKLQSAGEDQSLDITGESITRSTERPELYEEPNTYKFSADQSWDWEGNPQSVRVTNWEGWSDEIETEPWVVRDKQPVVPPKGTRFIQVLVGFDVYNDLGGPTNACSMSLLLEDGTVVEPTDIGLGACSTDNGYDVQALATFAIAPGARIQAIQVPAFTISEYSIPDITIPSIS